ncbi:guanine nucleotide-binding protein G(i) subunit alpha-3-like [Ptychodera flava]|uniref:guanine nucleotide-binding protein G(i) subunit alpha-3-like n=1 Tax=Ptychodera flava TaxID=63121 RepID=UPI00396A93E5
MGSGASKTRLKTEQEHARIEEMIRLDNTKAKRTAKLLLLGASGSGKSTFVKQMRIMHQDGFSEADRLRYKNIIQCNIIGYLETLLDAMMKLGIKFADVRRKLDEEIFHQYFQAINVGEIDLSLQAAVAIERLWKDQGVQKCFEMAREDQFTDSVHYFLGKLRQLAEVDYLPSDQDILQARTATIGIVETSFQYQGYYLSLVDVGGQRTERRKWIHCFQDCNSIIFIVALNIYDLVMTEDKGQNQMHDSLQLFRSTCNNRWLRNISFILFLNKMDLFGKKLPNSPLTICFPEYTGSSSKREAAAFIKKKFEAVVENIIERSIYTHFTVATDTKNMALLFNDVVFDVLMKNLQNCRLL